MQQEGRSAPVCQGSVPDSGDWGVELGIWSDRSSRNPRRSTYMPPATSPAPNMSPEQPAHTVVIDPEVAYDDDILQLMLFGYLQVDQQLTYRDIGRAGRGARGKRKTLRFALNTTDRTHGATEARLERLAARRRTTAFPTATRGPHRNGLVSATGFLGASAGTIPLATPRLLLCARVIR